MTPSHIRYRCVLGVVVASVALAVFVVLGGRLPTASGTLNDVLVVEAGLLGFLIAAVTIAGSMAGAWSEREINHSVFGQIIGASIKTTKHLLFATSVNLLALSWLRIPTLALYVKGAAAGAAWMLFGLSMSLTVGCLNMLGSLVLETSSPFERSKRGNHP